MKIKMLWPVRSTEVGDVSTGRWYTGAHNAGKHSGIDVYVNGIDIRGYDVIAAKDGKVVKILSGCKSYNALNGGERCQAGRCKNEVKNGYCNDTVGNMVILEHEIVKEDGSIEYLYSQYCHLEEISVSLNQLVKKGVKIGTVGSTGESSAPHLHFSVSTGYSFWGRDRINNNPCNINVSGISYGTDGYEFEYFDSTIDLFMNLTSDDNSLFQDNWGYAKRSDHEIISPENSTNYRFLGWYTARTGGTKVTKYSDIPAGTMTLYAQWVETVTVSYMKNIDVDGGPVVCVKTHDVGAALRPLPAMEERPGYTFIGWFTSATGGGKYEDYSVAKSSRTKIWAHWEYNIELYLNEGDTVPVKTVTASTGKCYEKLISAGMYTKCGYDHVGWAYDAERKNECDLADYVDNKTKKLYAIWKVKKVEVNYNYGYEVNGSAVTGEGNVDYGETYDDVTGTDVPDMGNMVHPDGGYDFAGWYHDKVEETDKVVMDEDHTLTAKWEPKEFTVSFITGDECDFMKPIPPVTVRYGEKFGCLPKPSSNKLYDFSRWYVVYEDGEIGDTVTSDTIVTQTVPFSLKAEWITKKYVTYNYENEDGNMVHYADHMNFGEAYTDVPILTEKTGYDVKWVFSGRNSPYDGTQFFPGMLVIPEHPSDISSEYTPSFMRVNFDYNGGVDKNGYADQHQMQRYGDPYATEQYNPTREGYILAGWYYDRECTMPIESDDVITNPEPHTVYAGWTTKLITVTFDAGAYANDCGTKSVGVGLPYGELPVPVSNKHHIFKYWEIGEEDNDEFYGVEVRPDSIVEMDVDHTLSAIWESRRWLYLDPNGGTVSNNRRSVHYGENYPYLFVPEREGYEFAGWFFREGEYDGVEVTMELMVLPEHPDTVVAEWIPISEE